MIHRAMIESDGRIGVVVCDCSGGFLLRARVLQTYDMYTLRSQIEFVQSLR